MLKGKDDNVLLGIGIEDVLILQDAYKRKTFVGIRTNR